MTASLPAKVIRTVSGWYVKNIDARKADVGKTRRLWALGVHLLIPAFGVRVEQEIIGGVAAERLTPKKAIPGKILFYLHGGAFVMGNPHTHRQLVSHIARAGAVTAVVPDYRLAPEHKFPAAIEDCVAAYEAMLKDGVQPADIVIAGDSAGGNLAVTTMLALRNRGIPLPGAAVLLSPIIDLTASGESMASRAEADPWFRPENVPIVADYYCEKDEVRDPLVSPLFADLSGLPPLYIQVGDREILLSDSERLANMQRAAGGEAVLEVWPGMWHVFQVCTRKMPESMRAIRKIGEYIRRL